jgi:carboxyl-terminal processing protease
MKNNLRTLVPVFIALALTLGYFMGRSLSSVQPKFLQQQSNDFGNKLESILQIIEQKYVDTINRTAFMDKAINDVLHKLDPHSNYIPAKEVARMMEGIDGKFGGIGVRFSIHRDSLAITHVIPFSPSEKAGLQPGDRIIAIDGESVVKEKLTNQFVMDKLKGEPGTTVQVTLLRKGKTLPTKIVRGVIPLESISCATLLKDNIGYVRLEQFSQTSSREFFNAISQLREEGMKKLIFDLRDNGGGVLSVAIEIVDEFLHAGKLIVYTQGANQPERRYTSSSRGILKDLEVVVLINQNSASASEIVAGALQDNDRGTIMGRRSFGKGLVQEDISLRDGSNVRLTVARYYTPSGRCIQRPYGDDIDYSEEFYNRYENGELYGIDSTLFVDSLKYVTPKGKVVYGGGGIMPDIFLPYDSSGSSFYLTELRYGQAFNRFAFDKANEWGRKKWKNEREFTTQFTISNELLNEFINYSEKELKIVRNPQSLEQSKTLIKKYLKAEIARQYWIEQGYFRVVADYDTEIIRAIEILNKK